MSGLSDSFLCTNCLIYLNYDERFNCKGIKRQTQCVCSDWYTTKDGLRVTDELCFCCQVCRHMIIHSCPWDFTEDSFRCSYCRFSISFVYENPDNRNDNFTYRNDCFVCFHDTIDLHLLDVIVTDIKYLFQ